MPQRRAAKGGGEAVRQGVLHFSSGDSGSPLLVQIVTRAACRLLLITGGNAELVVVTVLKRSVLRETCVFLKLRIFSVKCYFSLCCSFHINK